MPGWRMVAAVVLLLVAGCGPAEQVVDAGVAPTRPAAAPDEAGTAATGDDAGVGAGTTAGPGSTPQDDPSPVGITALDVYFTQGERLQAVRRPVRRVPRIGAAVLEQLLAGPDADEQAAGYGTEIPSTTRLRGLTITDRVAIVDLSGDFESGGGTSTLTLRLAQVACTLDQFPTVDGVRFALDGQVVDVFSGDGIIIDEPVSCADYAEVTAG